MNPWNKTTIEDFVKVDPSDDTVVISLVHPKGCIGVGAWIRLGEALDYYLAGEERGVVIHGHTLIGQSETAVFSTGNNLREYACGNTMSRFRYCAEHGRRVLHLMQAHPRSVVVAAGGSAWAAGFELIVGSGYSLTVPGAVFMLPETRDNLHTLIGGSINAPRRSNDPASVVHKILRSEEFDAEECQRLGLVDEVVDFSSELVAVAKQRVAKLRQNALQPKLIEWPEGFDVEALNLDDVVKLAVTNSEVFERSQQFHEDSARGSRMAAYAKEAAAALDILEMGHCEEQLAAWQ